MALNCGIVGLPNVGKSTLFNALTNTALAQAENYPFCTIEPNIGKVAVLDDRLEKLATIVNPAQIVPAQIEFVDIAGLVKGASKGEGLGNQFLANIREVNAIIHVLRCFENPDITHVEGSINPIRDAEIIETELMLADLESLEKRLDNIRKKAKSGDKEAKEILEVAEPAVEALSKGLPARSVMPEDKEKLKKFNQLFLLTAKPVLYVCNVNENEAAKGNAFVEKVRAKALLENNKVAVISAAIEAEIATLASEIEKLEFLESIGLKETGLSQVIKQAYALLGLQTYFTAGPKEVRAWTIKIGAKAPEAAGVIHTDFEKGFIRAQVISFDDYMAYGGEQKAAAAGKLKVEGKDYVFRDGDVAHFLFNV